MIEEYLEKAKAATVQKQNERYATTIHSELSKPEWQDIPSKLEKALSQVKDYTDFKICQSNIDREFNSLFILITAPGVNNFIDWLVLFTDNKVPTNTDKLREFLIENFSTGEISNSIEIILTHKDTLNRDRSIFRPLLKEISKELKKRCFDFLAKPELFENQVDDFLEDLAENLSSVTSMTALSHTNLESLYTQEQISNNIAFYHDVILGIVDRNQDISQKRSHELHASSIERAKNRISDILSCITLLDGLGLAVDEDMDKKSLFLKFTNEMASFNEEVEAQLDEFLTQKWQDYESQYETIKDFYTNRLDFIYLPEWDSFSKRNELQVLVNLHGSIGKENPIKDILLSKTPLSAQQKLTRNKKQIDSIDGASESLIADVKEMFQKLIDEYELKNLTLLSNLSREKPSIIKLVDEIKDGLDGVRNMLNSLDSQEDPISYFNTYFASDLITYDRVCDKFTDALRESGMEAPLDWLNDKLADKTSAELSIGDMNAEMLTELLKKGLIGLTVAKKF